MSIVVNPAGRADEWMSALSDALPGEQLHLWPQVGDPALVEYVLAWSMTADELATFPNLAAVFSLGAGVDQWLPLLADERFAELDVVRLVDPAMADEMAAYAVHWVVHFQRSIDQFGALRQERCFTAPPYDEAAAHPVGIMGHGAIGRRVARIFADLGYPVNAWSRLHRPDDDAGSNHFTGRDELDAFLAASRAVINLLPSTPATAGLLDGDRLAAFADGAVFVNMGRGDVAREQDLIAALDDGPLRAVVLDVTDPEPPPTSSPLFDHPRVVLTGHTAGPTLIGSGSRIVADNIVRLRRGEAAHPLLDPDRGY